MNYRLDRINGEMQKSISSTIRNKLKDPRINGMVSVLSVDCAKDLKTAKVCLSVYQPDKEKREETFDAICKSAGFIRRQLSADLKDIRTTPTLTFTLDDSIAYSAKIESILEDIKKNETH